MIALTWDRTWDLYIWALFTSPWGMNSAIKIRRRSPHQLPLFVLFKNRLTIFLLSPSSPDPERRTLSRMANPNAKIPEAPEALAHRLWRNETEVRLM